MGAVLGFAACLPERVVTHEELAGRLGVEPDWILQACGIRERRYAAEGQTVVDLAEGAARRALDLAGLQPGDLGAILVGTGTPHRRFPGVSASLQQRLGNAGALAFDVHLASCGGLVALCLAEDLCTRYGPVLVVGAEKMSEVVLAHPAKETAILFGDGAGACVVAPGTGPYPIRDARAASDGAFADDLWLGLDGPLAMNGRAVIMQANRKLAGSVQELLGRNGLGVGDVDLFLFHQANLNLLKQVAKGLGIEESRVFVNLQTRGNTSAASVLIAAAEAQEQGLLAPGSRAVLAAFGSGFSHGALLLGGR